MLQRCFGLFARSRALPLRTALFFRVHARYGSCSVSEALKGGGPPFRAHARQSVFSCFFPMPRSVHVCRNLSKFFRFVSHFIPCFFCLSVIKCNYRICMIPLGRQAALPSCHGSHSFQCSASASRAEAFEKPKIACVRFSERFFMVRNGQKFYQKRS